MSKPKAAVSHRQRLFKELRTDLNAARAYLAASIEGADPRVLFAALRTVQALLGYCPQRLGKAIRAGQLIAVDEHGKT